MLIDVVGAVSSAQAKVRGRERAWGEHVYFSCASPPPRRLWQRRALSVPLRHRLASHTLSLRATHHTDR